MTRDIIVTSSFLRAMKKVEARNPGRVDDVEAALVLLGDDVFDPKLKTHKLAGRLWGMWACSVGYDLMIVFRLSSCEGKDRLSWLG